MMTNKEHNELWGGAFQQIPLIGYLKTISHSSLQKWRKIYEK